MFVINGNKILMQKRKGKHGDGTWSLPGGHLEFGESIEDCAARETMEEMGVKIRNIKIGPFTNDVHVKEEKHYITIFVVSEYDSGEAKVMEPEWSEEVGWFEFENMPSPLFQPLESVLKTGFRPSVS